MTYNEQYGQKDKAYFSHRRTEVLPFIPANIKTVLDVGCGAGEFGALLKEQYNCRVWGIEPDPISFKEAVKNIDFAFNEPFPADIKELSGKKFDVIFFNDVLEHLADPAIALTSCKNFLTTNGVIIASIPNIRWYPVILSLLRYKDFKYQKAGVMDTTHLRFFTRKSMIRLFEESGYRINKIEGINPDTSFKVFNFLNFILFNSQDDMKFPQFIVVASNNSNAG